MAHVAQARHAPGIHPVHAVFIAGTIPLFAGALLSDIAYFRTYHIQWQNFASWLIAGGLVLTGVALVFALFGLALGGLAVGLLIASGWYFTATLATQVFEPVAIDSLSFIRPFAQTAGFLGGVSALPSFDLGIVAGTFLGALIVTPVFGEFRLARFGEAGTPSILRYTLGGALMGFGGVLAAGCTVGAGLTGGSVLAISALIAISAMALAGAATDVLLDRAPTSSTASATGRP